MHSNSGVNKVFLIGRVETLPKKHQNAQGRIRLFFSLTTDETIRSGKQLLEHSELHHLVIDADHPDVKELELLKGAQLYVLGKAQTRAWTDTENIKRYKTEIWVTQLEML